MKKLLFLLLVLLSGCGSKAPKCEEDDIVVKFKEVMSKAVPIRFIISNIRTNSINETSKSCNCTAQLEFGDNLVELNYTAQRTSNGEIYLELER